MTLGRLLENIILISLSLELLIQVMPAPTGAPVEENGKYADRLRNALYSQVLGKRPARKGQGTHDRKVRA
jgi:hypothetical protein